MVFLLSFFLIGIVTGSPMGGGKCETTADCVVPNVCSKWGWCQWTKIYGEDGPSQGSDAPGGGTSGQCKTSADCASRVPYCSKLGYCHGGRLPFDEAQLDLEGDVKEQQGFINNNPPKNSPILQENNGQNGQRRQQTRKNNDSNNNRKQPQRSQERQQKPQRRQQQQRPQKSQPQQENLDKQIQELREKGGPRDCPGSLDQCVEACVPLDNVTAYGICAKVCGDRCGE